MDDRRAAEGVEHLQAAARELLGAARAFLDVVEEVVEDDERLSGAAATVADLVRGIGARRPQPWEHSAWEDDDERGASRSADWWDEPYEDDEPVEASEREPDPAEDAVGAPAEKAAVKKAPAKKAAANKAPAEKAAAKKAPAKKAAAKRATSRVRRIAVD